MKKIYTSLCCIAVLFTFKAQAQMEDYVITTKGDTLKCNISSSLFGAAKYQLSGQFEKKMGADIKEYYVRRNNFRNRAVFIGDDKRASFLEVVENGNISLYRIVYRHNYSTTTQWYVGKGSDHVSILKSSSLLLGKSRKDRKDDFADMLKDKPEVYDKYMAEKKFSFNAIQNLVHLYNTGESLKDKDASPEAKKDDD